VTRIAVENKVLNENARIAAELRQSFQQHNVLCLNLISSPGAGKTSLLERTLESFPSDIRVAVLTGDIQTENDARRLAQVGNQLLFVGLVRDNRFHLSVHQQLGLAARAGDLEALLLVLTHS
jgi:hydrogenase nickel incorporation protein HypB